MEDIEFFTVEEVCEILNLSNQTIRKLIKEGKIKAVKLGRVYRVPRASLIQLKMKEYVDDSK